MFAGGFSFLRSCCQNKVEAGSSSELHLPHTQYQFILSGFYSLLVLTEYLFDLGIKEHYLILALEV